MNCKTCKLWQNRQRELDYTPKYGFCNQQIEYEADGFEESEGDIKYKLFVHNPWEKVGNDLLDADSTIKRFSSELVTHREFGCKFYEPKTEK